MPRLIVTYAVVPARFDLRTARVAYAVLYAGGEDLQTAGVAVDGAVITSSIIDGSHEVVFQPCCNIIRVYDVPVALDELLKAFERTVERILGEFRGAAGEACIECVTGVVEVEAGEKPSASIVEAPRLPEPPENGVLATLLIGAEDVMRMVAGQPVEAWYVATFHASGEPRFTVLSLPDLFIVVSHSDRGSIGFTDGMMLFGTVTELDYRELHTDRVEGGLLPVAHVVMRGRVQSGAALGEVLAARGPVMHV